MNAWAALMLVTGGLFAGGVVTIAWSNAGAWRAMPTSPFLVDFARTIRTADKVQPALLVATIVATAAVGYMAEGTSRIAAAIGGAGFVSILVLSAAVLVPLQRRIVASAAGDSGEIASMRLRWIRGHLGRSTLAVLSFASVVIASVT